MIPNKVVSFPSKEKLRMKILTRLSKEGSSAEEPLNIPLSDYSSDEGDTSTSSSEDEAGKDSMAELEGPCCSSLRVPPSSPVLPQKFKGNKKGKKSLSRTPTKPYRRRARNAHRIVLDIPTAEPASDFFDCTSDEDSSPFVGGGGGHQPHQLAMSDTENTVNRSFRRRHKYRQSDRIKKLTMLGCETQYLMPPELIVRSAASRYLSEEEDDKNRMVMSIIKEFPPISKERSWQGFNRATAERNRAELIKPMSPDHIFAHLSFKRSIWTGTHSDGYVNEAANTINSRPLSWGVPPVLVKSTHYDNEALLTACSQKLAAWKDEKRSLKEKHHKSLSRLAAKDKENRSAAASRMKQNLTDQYNSGKQKTTSDKKLSDSSEGSGIAKVRRKTRSTLNKIAEKAEIITHLSRSARSGQSRRMAVAAAASLFSSSGSPRKATSTSNLLGPVSGSQTQLLVSSQSLKTPIHTGANKFKTGGIVVTAAQPLHHSKQRKTAQGHLRAVRTPSNSNNNNNQSFSTSPTKLPTTTTIDIQLTTLCSETESEKNVKIVSSQKKHKKKHRIGNRDKSASGGRAPV